MTIRYLHQERLPPGVGVVAVPVFSPLAVPEGTPVAVDLDHLSERGFEGKVGQAQPVRGADGRTVVAVGVGEAARLTADSLRQAAAAVVRAAWQVGRAATTLLDAAPSIPPGPAAQAVAEGAGMAAYRFSAYKSDPRPCRLEQLDVVAPHAGEVQAGLDRGATVAEAVCLARDLVNEPAGSLTPSRLAAIATDVAEGEGLSVTVMDQAAIAREGLGGLAGVAQGSEEPPRLVELVYEPPDAPPTATVVLVGKGITFDSGGLSIKTADGMMRMKTDMSGAAAVLATLSALPSLGARVKVVGIMPCTENMPGGGAVKPGDVLRMRNGKTVEVLNTDAEGRLVLADGLSLAVEAGPDAIVDVATLTGAQVVALGRRVAALMGNHQGLVDQVRGASEAAGEPAWPMPLPDAYRSHLDSEVADVKNIGKQGEAGSVVAGLFLREFVGDVPWAHLDIAGPARADEDDGYLTKGGTGAGVRTLVQLLTTFEPPAGPGPVRPSPGP